MFPKKLRLPIAENRTGFARFYSSPYFLLKSRGNKEGHNRFAVVIPAGSVKKSTHRHFWKRRITEYFKQWPNFEKDFLVIASPKMETADKENVGYEFDKALKFLTSQKDSRISSNKNFNF
jgi:ribonuclease P protein component